MRCFVFSLSDLKSGHVINEIAWAVFSRSYRHKAVDEIPSAGSKVRILKLISDTAAHLHSFVLGRTRLKNGALSVIAKIAFLQVHAMLITPQVICD